MPTTFALTVPLTLIALVRLPAQESLAVAPGSVKTLWHSTVIGFAPLSVIVGGVVSTTFTVLVTGVAALPEGSLTLYVSV